VVSCYGWTVCVERSQEPTIGFSVEQGNSYLRVKEKQMQQTCKANTLMLKGVDSILIVTILWERREKRVLE
jgi:hypothetical protein